MKKFQFYFSAISFFVSVLGFIITLKNLNMSEAQYYGIKNDKWNTTLGESITGIFVWEVVIQFLVYFFLFLYHFYFTIKHKRSENKEMLKILLVGVFLLLIWMFFTKVLGDNGQHDLLWGPADTGLCFISISSLVINYAIFSHLLVGSLVSPRKIYLVLIQKNNF